MAAAAQVQLLSKIFVNCVDETTTTHLLNNPPTGPIGVCAAF